MITTGAKLYFGLAIAAAAAALAYAWGSDGGFTGALTLGLHGGVGDRTGFVVLGGAACISAFLGGLVVAFRDADADAVEQVAQVDAVPEVTAPQGSSYWPVLAAVAAGCVAVGLVTESQFVVFGIVLGTVVLLEWMVSSWSDRATGDPVVNRRIRNRMMNPIEVPVFGVIGIFAVVLCISRVLLTVNEHASVIVAIGVAVLVFAGAWVVAVAPRAVRSLIAVVCVLVAVGVIAGGIIGAAQGSRTYEKHTEEHPFRPPDRNQPVPTTAAPN